MRTDTAPRPTLLSDYTPYNFSLDSVTLDFDLRVEATQVTTTLSVSRKAGGPMRLNGEGITLKSVSIDGQILARKDYQLTQTELVLDNVPDNCVIEIITQCNPSQNATLMGLYVSGGRFCTQCEAEGFRRITYYPDRPDVLSVFTVKITADKSKFPYLLANGNMTDNGEAPGGRHFAVWEDPFPKPCYLFALVAGDFDILEDSFTTMSGRDIPLTIYVDRGDAPRADYAMDALKRSMRWDETAFGREYDLDRFMIVAVRDFNFGAMENKGLNIFNSSLLLADGPSATDMNFERIESVVAHEYFHNWTGNRITCRDWFQLCLKEGFTVFRDQEFSADQRGAAVQRIKDVRALRARQFAEDAGPLAHPVRPSQYEKIDNFYTATIYEKGAELIRMLKTLLGADDFRKGCDYYFETLDGTAATVEQFIESFEAATDRDLSQFMLWYEQAGTPVLDVKRDSSSVTFTQSLRATPGQKTKRPMPMPIKWQVIGKDGPVSDPQMTVLNGASITVDLPNDRPDTTLSVLQDFSSPVRINSRNETGDYLRLMGGDPNSFNRWDAGQTLATKLLSTLTGAIESGRMPRVDTALRDYVSALRATLLSPDFDNNFKALTLSSPSVMTILQTRKASDPTAAALAVDWLHRAIGDRLRGDLLPLYNDLQDSGPFSPDAAAAGRRALKNASLALMGASFHPQAAPLALEQFNDATNMTDELSALVTLSQLGGRRVDQSLSRFYEKWEHNPLVIDKWFAVQAMRKLPGGIHDLSDLTEHSAYDRRNPNRVRALVGNFAMSNPHMFHNIDGTGYDFFTAQILDMDSRNPQVAARLAGAYEIWPKLDKARQALIQDQLRAIMAAGPSQNLSEIAGKILG
ncbi:aminopeptidase N [Fretibacter rubidus]|uniref:aminopeptidase N n=1 Tax=Fretibacter rubidus TaxID=570162 RepID=UPI00352AC96A